MGASTRHAELRRSCLRARWIRDARSRREAGYEGTESFEPTPLALPVATSCVLKQCARTTPCDGLPVPAHSLRALAPPCALPQMCPLAARLEGALRPCLGHLEALASTVERLSTAPFSGDPRAVLLMLAPTASLAIIACFVLVAADAVLTILGGVREGVFALVAVWYIYTLASYHHRELKQVGARVGCALRLTPTHPPAHAHAHSTYICIHTYAHAHMHMHTCTCTHAHAHMHICTYAHAPYTHMHPPHTEKKLPAHPPSLSSVCLLSSWLSAAVPG